MNLLHFSTAPQGSEEWLEARKCGVTSTDAAAALGLSKWATPLKKWQEKIGIAEREPDNWNMRRGRALEPELRRHYADTFGRVVNIVDGVLVHPEIRFMLASLDGVTEDGRLVEFKTAGNKSGWGEAGTDEIPQEYLIQVQHAMIVTAIPVADVHVSFFGNEPVTYTVEADKELQGMIINGEREFWDKVQSRVEPEPVTLEEMKAKYKISEGNYVTVDDKTRANYINLLRIRKELSELMEAEAVEKEAIQRYLLSKGGSVLVTEFDEKLVTWNEQKGSKRFDTKAFESAHPDLYAQFCKIGEPVRRFLVKGE